MPDILSALRNKKPVQGTKLLDLSQNPVNQFAAKQPQRQATVATKTGTSPTVRKARSEARTKAGIKTVTAPSGRVYDWNGTPEDEDRILAEEEAAAVNTQRVALRGQSQGLNLSMNGGDPNARPYGLPRGTEPPAAIMPPMRGLTEIGNHIQDAMSSGGVSIGMTPLEKQIGGHGGGLLGGLLASPFTIAGGAGQFLDPQSTPQMRAAGPLEAFAEVAGGKAIEAGLPALMKLLGGLGKGKPPGNLDDVFSAAKMQNEAAIPKVDPAEVRYQQTVADYDSTITRLTEEKKTATPSRKLEIADEIKVATDKFKTVRQQPLKKFTPKAEPAPKETQASPVKTYIKTGPKAPVEAPVAGPAKPRAQKTWRTKKDGTPVMSTTRKKPGNELTDATRANLHSTPNELVDADLAAARTELARTKPGSVARRKAQEKLDILQRRLDILQRREVLKATPDSDAAAMDQWAQSIESLGGTVPKATRKPTIPTAKGAEAVKPVSPASPVVAKVEPKAGKEPWQMDRDAYAHSVGSPKPEIDLMSDSSAHQRSQMSDRARKEMLDQRLTEKGQARQRYEAAGKDWEKSVVDAVASGKIEPAKVFDTDTFDLVSDIAKKSGFEGKSNFKIRQMDDAQKLEYFDGLKTHLSKQSREGLQQATVPLEAWQKTKVQHWRERFPTNEYGRHSGGDAAYARANQHIDAHKKAVQQALKEGKPVPAEVLKDYPDLATPKVETPSPVTSKVGEGVKEPWQMTRKEWANSLPARSEDHTLARLATKQETQGGTANKNGYNSVPEKDGYDVVYQAYGKDGAGYYYTPTSSASTPTRIATLHDQSVKKAIKEGKPVPKEVLADYPDLAPSPKPVEKVETGKEIWRKPSAEVTPDEVQSYVASEMERRFGKATVQSPVKVGDYEVVGVSRDASGKATGLITSDGDAFAAKAAQIDAGLNPKTAHAHAAEKAFAAGEDVPQNVLDSFGIKKEVKAKRTPSVNSDLDNIKPVQPGEVDATSREGVRVWTGKLRDINSQIERAETRVRTTKGREQLYAIRKKAALEARRDSIRDALGLTKPAGPSVGPPKVQENRFPTRRAGMPRPRFKGGSRGAMRMEPQDVADLFAKMHKAGIKGKANVLKAIKEKVDPDLTGWGEAYDNWTTTAGKAVAKARPGAEEKTVPTAKHTVGEKIGGTVRSLMNTADISWSGVQGSIAGITDTRAWAKGFGNSMRSLRTAKYDEVMAALKADPDFEKVVKSGVDLPGINPQGGPEQFFETPLTKAPVIGPIMKGSERAFDGAASTTRYMMAKNWIKLAEELGGKPLDDAGLKVLGDSVNSMTGRGSSDIAKALSKGDLGRQFFAPSYWVSQYETAFARPLRQSLKYGKETGNYGPAKVLARKYARLATVGTGMLYGAKEGLKQYGWEVETDPRSSAYGKAVKVIGNQKLSVDILPPQISAPVKTVAGLLFGIKDKSGNVDAGSFGEQGLIGRTVENKAGPMIKQGLNIKRGLHGEESFSKSYDPRTGEGLKNIGIGQLPLSVQGGKELMEAKGLSVVERAILWALLPFGRSANVYEQKPKK